MIPNDASMGRVISERARIEFCFCFFTQVKKYRKGGAHLAFCLQPAHTDTCQPQNTNEVAVFV